MNPIIETLKELDIDQNKIEELFTTLTQNPMMAMGVISSLGIPQEKLQSIMSMIMTNPALIKEAVDELGLDFSAVEKAKESLNK